MAALTCASQMHAENLQNVMQKRIHAGVTTAFMIIILVVNPERATSAYARPVQGSDHPTTAKWALILYPILPHFLALADEGG
jgi:hypothetical protein